MVSWCCHAERGSSKKRARMDPSWLSYVPQYIAASILAHPEASPVGREQRLDVVALFADVSGFTPISEALSKAGTAGTEELTQVLNAYFGPMIDLAACVWRYRRQVCRRRHDGCLSLRSSFSGGSDAAGHTVRSGDAAQDGALRGHPDARRHVWPGDEGGVGHGIGVMHDDRRPGYSIGAYPGWARARPLRGCGASCRQRRRRCAQRLATPCWRRAHERGTRRFHVHLRAWNGRRASRPLALAAGATCPRARGATLAAYLHPLSLNVWPMAQAASSTSTVK